MNWIERALAPVRHAGAMGILGFRATVGIFTRPVEISAWIREMEQIGVRSLGVAAIATLFTGMVISLQTALSLPALGIKYYIGTIVGKTLVRELSPVLTALIVGGRIGAGMTAELGTMKVTEQIDALRSMATDPIKKLVTPKLVATLVMLPALTALGDILGILGGLLVAMFQLSITPGFYLNDVLGALSISDIMSGIGKSFFFAFFVTIIGCYNGLNARGGADGVGRATTDTVVMASIMVLVSDFFLTKLFYLFF